MASQDDEQLKFGADTQQPTTSGSPSLQRDTSSDQTCDGEGVSAFDRRGEDSSYGGGERGKDFEASGGGSAYGDGQTDFGGAGRLNDDSYSKSEHGGSTRSDSSYPDGGEDDSARSGDLAGQERRIYP
ncbi:hypothetical protein JCM8097_007304 [Rhodosporidiobolus ruineniae]